MRFTDHIRTKPQRRLVLVLAATLGFALVAGMASFEGWVAAGLLAVAVAVLLGLLKMATETAATSAASMKMHEDLGDRIQSLKQQVSVVEMAVLRRLHAVEKSSRDQVAFNEAIVSRARETEKSLRNQVAFGESILKRLRIVESRGPQSITPPGQIRRLERARAMIAGALEAVEDWGGATGIPLRDVDVEADIAVLSSVIPDLGVPLVSVIVTCFNEEQFVREALESIRRQSFEDWECIVVDDASTDGSVAEIVNTIASDSRFTLIQQPGNLDVGVARNTGLKMARGQYVVFLDADDLLMRESIQDRVDTMQVVTDTDVVGVFCGIRIADQDVALNELPDAEPWGFRMAFVDFVSSRGENQFGTPCPLLRLDVVLAHDGFNEDQSLLGDFELWLRLMRDGYYFIPSDYTTIVYRQIGPSKSHSRAAEHVEVGHSLIESAYEAASLGSSRMMASYPFGSPLPHYEALLTRTRRAIQYAAMTLLRGETEPFESILRSLEPGSWPLIARHVDIHRKTSDGFRRAAGLDPADMVELRSDMESLFELVESQVRTATS